MKQTVSFPHLLAVVTLILISGCLGANGGTRAVKTQAQQRRRAFNSFSSRIVGGNNARNGRYPYAQISLATEAGMHQCGGSLIAPDIILTAGHCHGFFSTIRVNIYNIRNQLEDHQIFKAERMHFHPNFDELWFRYDFLLLQLNGTVQGVQPVRINSDNSVPEKEDPLTVVGWGLTDPEDTTAYPDTLKEVTVNYMSNDSCEQTSSKGQRLYQGYIFNDMLCAMEDGKDACSGDSGAPLIRRGSTPDQDTVVGVVSWGNGCATDYPGVYARISHQYQWIKDLVCAVSQYPPASFRCVNPVNTGNSPTIPAPAPSPTAGLRPQTPAPALTDPIEVPEGYLPIKVQIQLDLRSKDTGWSLVSTTGEIIAEVKPGEYTLPYELVEQQVYLPRTTQFVFVMKDTQGDGICCQFGGGWYQVGVVLTDGVIKPLVKGYGTFALSSTNVFMTPGDNFPVVPLGIEPPPQPLEGVLPPAGSINNTGGQLPLAQPTSMSQSAAAKGWSCTPLLVLLVTIPLLCSTLI